MPVESWQPTFARHGAVLAACFSIGVAWPLLGGLGLVQRPPGSSSSKSGAASTAVAAPSEVEAVGAAAEDGAEEAASARARVLLEDQVVASCQRDSGLAPPSCDAPQLGGRFEAPLERLATCDAAHGAAGVLSLGTHLDFTRGRVTRVKLGHSTTMPKDQASRLIACVEPGVVGTSLDGVEHEHARYWVYHLVRFLPPGSGGPAPAAAPEAVVPARGQATIGYTAAVVREGPSADAKVATQLAHGTRIDVTARSGDYYRVEQAGKELGWIHRRAIGL